jgi:hypothetical protein
LENELLLDLLVIPKEGTESNVQRITMEPSLFSFTSKETVNLSEKISPLVKLCP